MDKRKLIISAMIGAIAVSTLSVSLSLAWYASSDRLKVSSFDIDMNGDVQLLMSTSRELDTFKEKLTAKDLVEQEFLFAPVSSMYQNKWFDEKKDMPSFYDSSSPALDGVIPEEEATAGFFSKKIYLLSNVIDYYVTLDTEETVFDSNEAANFLRAQAMHAEYSDATVEDIAASLNSLRQCLRMSILVKNEETYNYYIVDPFKSENKEVLFGGPLDNDGDGYYDFYTDENGDKREVIYGDVADRSKIVYDSPVDPNGVVEPLETKGSFYGNSFEAKSRIDTYTFNKESSTELNIAKEDSHTLSELCDGNDPQIMIPCYRNEPTEVVISMYLEGWDKACVNQTMGACFNANLSFKLLRRIMK